MLNKILKSLGLCVLFGCSNNNDQQEINDLLNWYSAQLNALVEHIQADAAQDQQGHYPHAGKITYQPVGHIDYVVKNKHGRRLELSQKLKLTASHIEQTAGYLALAARVAELGWHISLQEHKVEGDGVDTDYSLDEYIADHPRYYVVRISGWL